MDECPRCGSRDLWDIDFFGTDHLPEAEKIELEAGDYLYICDNCDARLSAADA